MAKKPEKKEVEIPKMIIKEIDIHIEGDSPLIMHQWSEKAKKAMRDKQQKKATKKHPTRNPKAEYEATIYRDANGDAAFPAVAFKAAAVRGAQDAGMKMTEARRMFHIQGDLIKISGDHHMREDMVRVGAGAADLRYRAEFPIWSATLSIRYNASIVSPAQLLNIINIGGFGCGIGEWRPEKNGQFGTFHVTT